ncbi:anti-sigma factor antagonist [Desulfonema ishimotonii]|uniref:Anti-sigma factor antagonist n=1 Tax=Desulfonema ishimotonii TaxID=45657 RepID=A0A401FW34_9BACT|nr:STAS domain-containing protein [Desulfonema ishimotonii]GBC61171.1 anti-sigma factor antagonist [Desulfonema ishimotonii]
MSLRVNIQERKRGHYVVALEGRLDANTSPLCEDRLTPFLTPATDVMMFDMTDLTYISSAGLRVIFKVRKAIERHSGKMILTNLRPQVQKVFEIINALPKENIFSSIQEVDDYLDMMQKKVLREQKGEV